MVIAIDEFQQIIHYPEKNIEALLRGVIQRLNNVNFIFSGSDTTMMAEIFTNAKRPFYQSTQMMHLDKIPIKKYIEFIREHLKSGRISMDTELINYVLEETNTHTYYVQFFFNRIYSSGYNKINKETLNIIYSDILNENEAYYSSYKDLLSVHQWKFLLALAHENGYGAVNSSVFIKRYNLSTASTINRAIKTLIEKKFIYKENGQYYVYDIFFRKWLSLQKY